MSLFNVKWSVTERVIGHGQHDDGVREGDVRTVASGKVQKEAESADAIRSELSGLLRQSYPERGFGPTYDLERTYDIDIEAA